MQAYPFSTGARSRFAVAPLLPGDKPMKPFLRTGEHIEGMHWIAEYHPLTHDILVLRDNVEVGTYCAPPTLFGDEEEMGAANLADHRSREAALRAYLRNFVKEHDAEE